MVSLLGRRAALFAGAASLALFATTALAAPPAPAAPAKSSDAAKAPKLDFYIFVASNLDPAKKPDGGGKLIDPKLVSWNEVNSVPLVHYDKLEVVHHATAPLELDKPFVYTFPGNGTKYEITLLGVKPDAEDKSMVDYDVSIVLTPADGKTSSAKITRKQGVRMVLGGRTYPKPTKDSKIFFSASISP